jgi:RimJ/RimL family protein N-acetyltransferase
MALRLQCDRPDIIYVTSTVNVRNVRMLAVNRRLGYREIRRRSLVQANVSDLGRQLGP